MPKVKSEVNYRLATSAHRRCATCVMFRPPNRCSTVTGSIKPEDVCNLWQAAPKH